MAKKSGNKATPAKAAKRGGVNRTVLFLTLMALVPFSLPTLLVMFVGLLPTIVAAVVERGNNRYGWVCVGGANFAGLAPWLFNLWFGHHTLSFAIEQVTSVTLLLVAYGTAGAGSLLYLALPPVVATIMASTAQHRSVGLQASQRKLVERWGDGVTTPEELL
ncbi:acyl-CoA synthetase [Telmatospirillum siberiense]|uniref:Acyl-CoA synthetase n=1 Tax=Telmatospirillum siberiense TaxID=382514 RepID=A0A2N3Q225_9PROT|nr:acyl-CoA synthetase [Telmatospirillum siberiense]PKU26661.1 acyl-CoA synthetase [Telmatospirillum siberiense]